MKKLINIFLVVFIAAIFFSCEDDEKNQITDTVEAPWVYFESIDAPVIDVTNLEGSAYTAKLVAPFNNVASYEIFVNLNDEEDADENLVLTPLKTITEFPADLSINATEVTTALGLTLADLNPGDKINFRVIITDNDGVEFNGADETQFLGDINNPGLQQALSYNTFISCPFNAADAAGEYTVSFHRFDGFFPGAVATRTVVAGPGENQITVVGGAVIQDGADDLIISVDPNTGIASYGGSGEAIHFNTFGPAAYLGVSGFVFSCTGTVDISIQSAGFIDNFLVMSKN
ncbi:hypothetical protein [uncultured Aquimarina sp.]|uniref:hypothetical protein n=1 Tax=uncultured Aquimarina sp. TaxID=575652 RepID=UPI0026178B72|nr:hypothetical protein [uncultured Aquimarina sp.]